MLSETHVKGELRRILASPASAIGKARACLRLSHRLKDASLKMTELGVQYWRKGETERSRRFASAASRLLELVGEVREAARKVLCNEEPLGFGYAPVAAYPSWQSPDIRAKSKRR